MVVIKSGKMRDAFEKAKEFGPGLYRVCMERRRSPRREIAFAESEEEKQQMLTDGWMEV